jgi:hypothetical protein
VNSSCGADRRRSAAQAWPRRRQPPEDVDAAARQRRHGQLPQREAGVEVAPKAAGLDLAVQLAVGRGDHPHVDVERAGRADREQLALLDRPQQLGLEVERQLADLVEEQRAALGGAKQAELALRGPGEGAALVAEQLALDQLGAERGAVERDEGAVPAEAMQLRGDALLARPALADQQHGRRVGRGADQGDAQGDHRQRVAEDGLTVDGGRVDDGAALPLIDGDDVAEPQHRVVVEHAGDRGERLSREPGPVARAEVAGVVPAVRWIPQDLEVAA